MTTRRDPAPEQRSASSSTGWHRRLAHARAGSRLVAALIAAAAVLVFLPDRVSIQVRAVASWDAFAATALLLIWFTILTMPTAEIRQSAQREDPSRFVALVLVVVGAGAALLAVVVLLQQSLRMQGGDKSLAIVLALSAVGSAWLLIHTVFTLRYAHQYHAVDEGAGALDFPGDGSPPDYLDFAYFAFVIGMTAQTADVSIRSRAIRRTVLLHGVVSFAFNTAVVALSIGVLTTLL